MSIIVFYLNPTRNPGCVQFEDNELSAALKFCETLRTKCGCTHVTISTELADHVGKAGVDTVASGKTPDGNEYDWSKKHRGAGPRKE